MDRGTDATLKEKRVAAAALPEDGRPRWRVLVEMGLVPCAGCTALVVAMVAARWWYISHHAFLFLLWNLFLAWLPWLFAVPIAVAPAQRRGGLRLIPLVLAWLAFLPNAPYIVTDLLHLEAAPPVPLWYDAALLFISAWTGCLLGFLSLVPVHRWVEGWLGRTAGWVFVTAVALLCGFGIYIGRFLRWNSWDLVVHPGALWRDFAAIVTDPSGQVRTFGVTVLFAVFMLFGYATFARLRTPPA